MLYRARLLIAALLLGASLAFAPARPAMAADVGVEATVDQTSIPIDGQVVFTITITGGLRQLPNPVLPALEADWSVFSGGSSRNFSFINGQVSSSAAFRFVLTPKRPGKLTIGKASVKIADTVYETTPITITVSATAGGSGGGGGGASPGGTSGRSSGGSTETGASAEGRDLFVTATVDKKSPYVQEQIILTFRFYQRVTLLEAPSYTKATTTQFWSEDLPPQRTLTEVIDGKRYHVTEIRTALFGTTAGDFTIGPATLDCTVPEAQRVLDNDPFSLFGRSMFGSKRVTLRTDPITIHVKPLPPGAPPEFAGAVGDFAITSTIDRTQATQGEPVTLTVTLSGTGNLRTVPDPTLPSVDEFKNYDSSSSSDVTTSGDHVRGQRTSQVLLVPLRAGPATIPPVSFAWFDPKSAGYKTARTAPIPIMVAAGKVTAGGAVGGGGRGEIEMVGQDIRFVRTDPGSLSDVGQMPWQGASFWFFQLLPLTLVIGSLLYDRHRQRIEGDLGFARQVRSGREAGRRLKRARELAARGDDGLFGELAAAISGYVGDRVSFLERCDMARFAPGAVGTADRAAMLEEAGSLIEGLKRGGL
jgi:hypothetical protein